MNNNHYVMCNCGTDRFFIRIDKNDEQMLSYVCSNCGKTIVVKIENSE